MWFLNLENIQIHYGLKKKFPKPYYETNGFKAKALYGNYATDIFEIMRKTVLKSRGFFE